MLDLNAIFDRAKAVHVPNATPPATSQLATLAGLAISQDPFDDCVKCVECRWLTAGNRCNNHRAAGLPVASLALDLVDVPQHCHGFAPGPRPQPAVEQPTEAPTAPPAPAKQQPWFALGSDWRTAARTWNNHRANCPTCIAADRTAATAGTGKRCEAGQVLHAKYEAAFDAAVG